MRVHLLSAMLLGLGSGAAVAHSELPTAEWCATGRIVEVSSFRLEESAIRSTVEATCSSTGTKTCGQFDDDYSEGLRAAGVHCGQYANPAPTRDNPDKGTTSPLVSGPKAYLSTDHHQLYELRMGVEGICLRCEAPLIRITDAVR